MIAKVQAEDGGIWDMADASIAVEEDTASPEYCNIVIYNLAGRHILCGTIPSKRRHLAVKQVESVMHSYICFVCGTASDLDGEAIDPAGGVVFTPSWEDFRNRLHLSAIEPEE